MKCIEKGYAMSASENTSNVISLLKEDERGTKSSDTNFYLTKRTFENENVRYVFHGTVFHL